MSKDTMNPSYEQLFPPAYDESRILVGCKREHYSASAIARAVEDCNAQVLNLNVTSLQATESDLVVDLRVNYRNTEPITRSLLRYGYSVIDVHSNLSEDEDRLRQRAKEVLHILEL